jgi:hypothetical protein
VGPLDGRERAMTTLVTFLEANSEQSRSEAAESKIL